MEAATAAIFSFGSNEMKEAAKKKIGSFLTQTQKRGHWICSKPRSAPNKNIKKERKEKKKTIQILVGVCGQLIFVEEFVYKFWNILGFYSFVLGIEYSGFVVLVCSWSRWIWNRNLIIWMWNLWVYGFLILLFLFKDLRSPFIWFFYF